MAQRPRRFARTYSHRRRSAAGWRMRCDPLDEAARFFISIATLVAILAPGDAGRAQTSSNSVPPTAAGPTTPTSSATAPPAYPPGMVALPTTPASAGLVNDWLRQENKFFNDFDIGGQFRARYVYQAYF